ncbi:hypothetical protein ABPG75_002143 [Micractinium tetrahymenae]
MTAADPHEGLASPLLGAHDGQLAGEPLLDLGGLYRDGSHGGLAALAGLPLSGQYAMMGALPSDVGGLPLIGGLPMPLPGLVPLHAWSFDQSLAGHSVGRLDALQDPLTVEGEDEHPRHASTQQPAFFHPQYQLLLQMQQAEQAQRELQPAPAGQGQSSTGVAAPAAGTSDQSTAWGGALLPEELLACWPQTGSVKQEAEEGGSGHASRSSSAQQRHPSLAFAPGEQAHAEQAQQAAGEGEASALAAVTEEGAAEQAARAPTPPGRRRTRSMSQQEEGAAAGGASVSAGGLVAALPGVLGLAQQEGREEEEGGSEEEQDEDEGRRKRKRRWRGGEAPPSPGGRPRRRKSAGAGAAEDDSKAASRTSKFRGVTRHRRSGRYEAHIWVKSLGRQLYLGGYEQEEHAAEAYDIAALKSKGRAAKINFGLDKYTDLLGCIDRISIEELVMAVRRQSQGFSRGSSAYRGVTHHPSGRFEARVGIPGSRHAYLGLFNEETEAARAYDRALVRLRGRSASTNFPLGDYKSELADHFAWQSRMLLGHARFLEIQSRVDLFEQWLKAGLQAFPELAAAADSAELAAQAEVHQAAQQEQQQAQQAQQEQPQQAQ